MIPDWQTNTVVISDRLPGKFPELTRGLEAILAEAGIPLHILPGTRDYWIRDYALIQVIPDRFVQFRYEPDYLLDGYPIGFSDLRHCTVSALHRNTDQRSIICPLSCVGNEASGHVRTAA